MLYRLLAPLDGDRGRHRADLLSQESKDLRCNGRDLLESPNVRLEVRRGDRTGRLSGLPVALGRNIRVYLDALWLLGVLGGMRVKVGTRKVRFAWLLSGVLHGRR